jgi:hypothetical protein
MRAEVHIAPPAVEAAGRHPRAHGSGSTPAAPRPLVQLGIEEHAEQRRLERQHPPAVGAGALGEDRTSGRRASVGEQHVLLPLRLRRPRRSMNIVPIARPIKPDAPASPRTSDFETKNTRVARCQHHDVEPARMVGHHRAGMRHRRAGLGVPQPEQRQRPPSPSHAPPRAQAPSPAPARSAVTREVNPSRQARNSAKADSVQTAAASPRSSQRRSIGPPRPAAAPPPADRPRPAYAFTRPGPAACARRSRGTRGHPRRVHQQADVDGVEDRSDIGAVAHEAAQPQIGLDERRDRQHGPLRVHRFGRHAVHLQTKCSGSARTRSSSGARWCVVADSSAPRPAARGRCRGSSPHRT